MKDRMQHILRHLLVSSEIQTSSELATILQVSSKTIRNDIVELNALLNERISSITAYRGRGYQLQIHDEDKFREFLQQFSEINNQIVPTNPEERMQYVLEKLLLRSSYLKMEDLADELFVSRSTLQNDLKQIGSILKEYNLAFDHRPNYGLKITGNEMQIRFCISEYLFNKFPSAINQVHDWLEILPECDIEFIRNSILSKLRKYKATITDVGLHNLVTHLAIACKRIREKNSIDNHQIPVQEINEGKDYKIANEIIQTIEKQLQLTFSRNEMAYLAIHLQGNKIVDDEGGEDSQAVIDDTILQLTTDILRKIDETYKLGLSGDKQLALMLNLHLQPAINRYKYNMNLRNPMIEEIKAEYPFSFELALTGAKVIEDKMYIAIDENEIGYIALHIGGALKRQNKDTKYKKSCLIVCASGAGTAQLLYYKLIDHFSNTLNIIGTTEYYNLKQRSLNDVDFIISTIPIRDDLSVPVIEVNSLLNKHDINCIDNVIYKDMNTIEKYLREKFVFLKKNLSTKEEVIHFIGDQLIRAEMVPSTFTHSVFEREEYAPTSYENLIAIPHPLQAQADETFWTIITLDDPIQWGEKPVQFIVFLNINKKQMESLQPMYEILIKLMENRELIQQLIQCESYSAFKTFLMKAKM